MAHDAASRAQAAQQAAIQITPPDGIAPITWIMIAFIAIGIGITIYYVMKVKK